VWHTVCRWIQGDMMSRSRVSSQVSLASWRWLLLSGVLLSGFFSVHALADPVGQWGRVTPIADDKHPNLFWNQNEIDELRNMILVQHSPPELVSLYDTYMKGSVARNDGVKSGHNLNACVSYMIEPSQAKADAIRAALLSFVNENPEGVP